MQFESFNFTKSENINEICTKRAKQLVNFDFEAELPNIIAI